MPSDDRSCIIIGGGISGLCAAYWLSAEGYEITLIERDSLPGGAMKTIHKEGFLIDVGPNSALETTPLFNALFESLDIVDKRVYANEQANNRYILREGMLHPIPMSPRAFFRTKLWSVKGKLRLAKEPFIGRANHEESIAEFVERRLGREFLDYAINPFVAGVYAGNPDELSVRMAFPKLYRLEEVYGGLVKGLIRGRKERKQRAEQSKQSAKMFSFIDGMGTFPHAIAKALGDKIAFETEATEISRSKGEYIVHAVTREGKKHYSASKVILATPAFHAAHLLGNIEPRIRNTLLNIYYPPVTMVFFGYEAHQVNHTLDGFGFLVPEKERRNILGTIWSSTIFPNRAPDGHVAFTTFVGGARQPQLTAKTDDELRNLVHHELSSILNITGFPKFYYIKRWKRAIPQYVLGYGKTVEQIEQFEQSHKGLYLCANYRGGIAVGDCLMSARRTVDVILNETL